MHALCVCVCDLFVTLCVTCNFDADARVRVSKNTIKKPMTKNQVFKSLTNGVINGN